MFLKKQALATEDKANTSQSRGELTSHCLLLQQFNSAMALSVDPPRAGGR